MEKIKEVSDSSSRKNKEESFAKVAMGSNGNTITSTHRAIWTAVTQLGASRKKRPKLAQYTK